MLKELRRSLKAEKQDNSIFDIVLYGSSVKGKADYNDIDIAVIFRHGKLKERLEKVQAIKRKIKSEKSIDIKAFLLEELFHEGFFGRSGIFIEGISIFDGRPFSYKAGFEGFAIFVYNLKNKGHTEKVKFNYLLSGRKTKGIVELLDAKHIAPGAIQVPAKKSLEFEEILKKHNVPYSKRNCLIEI